MFSANANPLAPSGGELRALRLSLNTPVVAIEELPVGPASAGIALHEGPGGPWLCLAVRSVRTGQLALFAPDEAWSRSEGPSLGLEAALSFAESMGFLFDEDLLANGDPGEAVSRWAELVVGAGPDADGSSAAGRAPRPVLSKFRLRPELRPGERAASAGRGEVWLRVLSRF